MLNTREVQNLPLIPRNPYNFGLLQANGRINRGFGFLNINVNGYLRRINYLLEGNTNTQGDSGSVRLMLVSDTQVSEIQLVTNGFSAEFGNTPGMIMNIITLSKATDDAPEQNMTTQNIQSLVLSDPTNRVLDKGNSFADQRHTFVMSPVVRPEFNFSNKLLHYLFNYNQFSVRSKISIPR